MNPEPLLPAGRPTAMQIVDRSQHGVWTYRARLACVPAAALLALTAAALTGCTSRSATGLRVDTPRAADVSLVRFNSCADALQNLRAAASRALGTSVSSTGAGNVAQGSGNAAAPAVGAAPEIGSAAPAGPSSYSTTNTATPGVDEPDIVKTDGRRIVTITGNVLRVVDVQTRQVTGQLDLSSGPVSIPRDFSEPALEELTPANLLLFGNRALIMFEPSPFVMNGPQTGASTAGSAGPGTTPQDVLSLGPELVLVDLSTGTPRIVSEYTMNGSLVDAREVGSIVRVVIQSAPRIYIPPLGVPGAQPGLAPQTGQAPARSAIAHAGVSQWLPRYTVTTDGRRQSRTVDCSSVSHPAGVMYSGGSMLTVLTFDLNGTSLGDGQPVTIVADGDTVYSDGASLYIASRQWTAVPITGAGSVGSAAASAGAGSVGSGSAGSGSAGSGSAAAASAGTGPAAAPVTASATAERAEPPAIPQYTGIYKFDISGPGRPVYEASGSVPGWLLGSSSTAEYSLSAWNGALRVATTINATFAGGSVQQSQSAVYDLEQAGNHLVVVGKVGGLGAGEQIYAVRFAGPVGYVVTFRQTDPLYTLDLSDPAQPRIAGQVQLSGYSAYLYPIDATHLIGIGQAANAAGQTTGTQISLFDVSDPAAPVRLAAFDVQSGHSEAEFDPHAFLYWPSSKLLVVPVQVQSGPMPAPPPSPVPQGGTAQGGTVQSSTPTYAPTSEAVVLHVGDSSFTELGTITQPAVPAYPGGSQILRSLIAGNALWTLSDAGLKANDMTTLSPLAWVPFG